MGLLVTLYLIAFNVYNSVSAPQSRGFSYVELWGFISQVPILMAIVEYGVVLGMLKYHNKEEHNSEERKFWLNKTIKKMDFWSFVASSIFIAIFNVIYWPVAS